MKTDVAQRLRRLQAEEGITIQEMANQCGISKASLTNYVRQKDPQKPGLDAVVAIAAGMHVSIDWLAGLTTDRTPPTATKHGDAMIVMMVVVRLLVRLQEMQDVSEAPILKDNKIAGRAPWEMAAQTMLDFMESKEIPASGTEEECMGEFDKIVQGLVSATVTKSDS